MADHGASAIGKEMAAGTRLTFSFLFKDPRTWDAAVHGWRGGRLPVAKICLDGLLLTYPEKFVHRIDK